MDSRRCGKNGWREGIREGDNIPARYARWGLKGGRRAVREPPLRSVRLGKDGLTAFGDLCIDRHSVHPSRKVQGWEFRIEPHVYSAPTWSLISSYAKVSLRGKTDGGDP